MIIILRMTGLGRGLIFQPVILACTYNYDIKITLQKGEKERKGEGGRRRERGRRELEGER